MCVAILLLDPITCIISVVSGFDFQRSLAATVTLFTPESKVERNQ